MRLQIAALATLLAGGVLYPELAWAQFTALSQRCAADSLPADQAELRLEWMRRCALLMNVRNPSLVSDIGMPASNGSPLYDYTEASDFFGLNSYLGSGEGFQANGTYITMLYSGNSMIHQTLDANGFFRWTKDPWRKRTRPYYPVYGNQYDAASGIQLFTHPTLADCSLYTSQGGGTTSTTFYVSGFCEALPVTPLARNVTVSNLWDNIGGRKYYSLSVPAGVSTITFETSGGSGDVDLYVQPGASPTFTTFSCRPFTGGNYEVCTFNAPSPGTWYVMLHAWSNYSGASLTARY
jgi:hypothetical protein